MPMADAWKTIPVAGLLLDTRSDVRHASVRHHPAVALHDLLDQVRTADHAAAFGDQVLGLHVDGLLLDAPVSSKPRTEDEGRTFVLELATEPVTELRLGRYEFKKAGALDELLGGELRRFIEVTIGVGQAETVGANYEVLGMSEAGFLVVQGVINHGNQFWTLARTLATQGTGDYYLLHWHGPKKYMTDLVIQVMESFRVG